MPTFFEVARVDISEVFQWGTLIPERKEYLYAILKNQTINRDTKGFYWESGSPRGKCTEVRIDIENWVKGRLLRLGTVQFKK